jgi:hypothetical protein
MTNPAKKQKNATTIRFDDDYTLQVIDKAAELLHQTRTGFLLSVAREQAEAVIRERTQARQEIEGFLEKGTFIPDGKEDERMEEEKKRQEHIKAWREFGEAILNSDEKLTGSPQRLKFKTPEEIDLL